MNFTPFDFDFDYSSMSGFEATETQLKFEPIDLPSTASTASVTLLIDLLTCLRGALKSFASRYVKLKTFSIFYTLIKRTFPRNSWELKADMTS